jgi:chromosome segregation ATPase
MSKGNQYYDSVHLASDQKDLLISQLKAEIFEIQQRDKDFLAMKDQMINISSKFRHLQDEKLLQDNDFRTKHDANMMTLHGLKKELDDLRFMLNDKNRSNGDLQDQIAGLRDNINRKDMEIAGAKSDCSQKSDQGFNLKKEIDNLEYEIKRLQEEKQKD